MSGISTHVLDTSRGLPAAGISVTLERSDGRSSWAVITRAETDADGRVRSMLSPGESPTGTFRLRFDTGAYLGKDAFFPFVDVVFTIGDASRNHHVPLLLSPFGYSTYRGS